MTIDFSDDLSKLQLESKGPLNVQFSMAQWDCIEATNSGTLIFVPLDSVFLHTLVPERNCRFFENKVFKGDTKLRLL
jgi:hypothetical protein